MGRRSLLKMVRLKQEGEKGKQSEDHCEPGGLSCAHGGCSC